MPPLRKLQVFVATFFWAMLVIYGWMAPRLYDRMARGYADFSNFYTAGRIVQTGRGNRLYDLGVQTQVQSEFSEAAALRNRALPYMRPPFEALVFLPLSYLPYSQAFAVWVLFSMILVVVTAVFLRPRIPGFGDMPWWLYYPGYFSFYPIAHGFVLGQDSTLMLLLFGLVTVSWLKGRDLLAGCFLGLAMIKFQLVLPLVFILLLKRQFRTLTGFAFVTGLLTGISAGVVGWRGLVNYPAYLWRLNEKGAVAGIYPSVMPSLRGLVQGWTDPLIPVVELDVITGILALVLLVWAAWQWRADEPRHSRIYVVGVGIILLTTLLAGYHEFGYDLSLLFPFVLLAGHFGLTDGQAPSSIRWTLVGTAALLMYPPLYVLLHAKAHLNLLAILILVLAWGFSRYAKSLESARHSAPAVALH